MMEPSERYPKAAWFWGFNRVYAPRVGVLVQVAITKQMKCKLIAG